MSVLGVTLLLVGAGNARAAEEDYPPSLDRPALAAWLRAHTDLSLDRVALAGPVHVVAVTPGAVSSTGVRRAVVDGEVVDRDWARTHQLVSWRTDVEVNCATNQVRSPTGKSYPQRRRKGGATAVFASADWTSPSQGDPIFPVVAAICRTDYPWPLRSGGKLPAAQLAQPDAPPAPSPPAAEPPPSPDAPFRTAVRVVEPAPKPAPEYAAAEPARISHPQPAASPALAQPPRPAAAGRGQGRFVAQVVAAPTEASARAALAALAKVLSVETEGLPWLVTPVNAGGKQLYRAMFSGLEGEPQAQTLCAAISRLGSPCIVRKLRR